MADVADLMYSESTNRSGFILECRGGKLDGVVAICDRAPSSLQVTEGFDVELISDLPETLRFICHMGAAYDSIDISSCDARSVVVSNCPHVVEASSADTSMFLILAALRSFNNGLLAIRNGT